MRGLILSLLSSLLLFYGCEKEVTNLPLPKGEAKLAVFGYLSPSDTLIKVQVSKSRPFFGKESKEPISTITNAQVVLRGNDTSITLVFDPLLDAYTANPSIFPIRRGNTYQLEVSEPGGLKCSAATTVPISSAQNITVKVDSSVSNNFGFAEWRYQFTLKWQDKAGEKNYYRLNVGHVSDFFGEGQIFSLCNTVIDDAGRDGELLSVRCETSGSGNAVGGVGPDDKAYVLTVDAAYYHFHESYYRYSDDDPFSEPVQLYTNIESGLGCFGSYLQETVKLGQ
jgi:hypothetical protein